MLARTLSSDKLNELTERLLSKDSSFLEELIAKVPSNMVGEAAETIVDFYLKHGQIARFATWAIKTEVESTKYYGELFREEKFAVLCVRRSMYDDVGMKYLTQIVSALIKEILSIGKPLTTTAREDKEGISMTKSLLSCMDKFINIFAESIPVFPVENLHTIHQYVTTKFQQSQLFIGCFVCFYFFSPAIVNPKKYGIAKNLPEYAFTSLITVSKLINDIASDSWQKHQNPQIAEYVKQKQSVFNALVLRLIDLKELQTITPTKRIVYSADEKVASTKQLYRVIKDFSNGTDSTTVETRDSPENLAAKLRQFIDRINNPNWKKLAENKDFVSFSLKDSESNILAIKSVALVKASPITIKNTLSQYQLTREWFSFIDHATVLKKKENYQEIYSAQRLPFPLSPRDLALAEYTWKLNDEGATRILVMLESLPLSEVPRKNGYVRANISYCGWDMMQDKSNPNYTLLTYVLHLHPGGSPPVWAINFFIKLESKKVLKMKALVEEAKKGKSFRESFKSYSAD